MDTQRSLIGRDAERQVLADLLAGAPRVVTVVGTGGVGKTRLAREASGALFCDVTTAVDEAGLLDHIGRACGVTFRGAAGPRANVDVVSRALRGLGDARVILDNFEQVVGPGASLLAELARRAPSIRWIVTSREPLRIPEETLLRLEPLSTLSEDGEPSLAARLFVRVLGREVTAEELALVDAIVARLDGIPLAIELAAARGAVLSLADLRERIERSIDVVSLSRRAGGDRHQRLTDTIRWSWDLLAEDERDALLALSVFSGSFGLEAAERVLAVPDALTLLLELVTKSLVVARPSGASTRFSLLETIRAFARDEARAVSAAHEAALARHAAYYIELAEGLARAEARAALQAEEENLDELARRLLAAPEDDVASAALALRLLVALGLVRRARYSVTRYAGELATAFARLGERGGDARALPVAVVGVGMELRAYCLLEAGVVEESRARYEDVQSFATEHGLSAVLGRSIMGLARIDANQGKWEEALIGFERAKELGQGVGDDELAVVAAALSDLHGSELRQTTLLAERAARDFFLEKGDLVQASFWECHYARGLVDYGRRDEAIPVFERVIGRASTSGDLRGEAMGRFGLGTALLALDRHEEALASLDGAVELFELVGARRYESYALGYAGVALHALGRLDAAEQVLGQAVVRLEGVGDAPNAALFLGFRAALLASSDRLFDAQIDLDRAEGSIRADRDVTRARTFYVQRGELELASARRERGAGNVAVAERAQASATGRLARATERSERSIAGESVAWTDQSLEPQLAARSLARSLHRASASDEGWLFEPSARSFRRPPAPPISVEKRKPVRRLLQALLEARLARAGVFVDADALVRAAWPDERLAQRVAKNRLYVAIDTLKKLGLEGILDRDAMGWRLSPDAKISLELDAPAPDSEAGGN